MATVTIEQDELEQLRLTARRFEWLLATWAATCGDRPIAVIDCIDHALEHGDSPEMVAAIWCPPPAKPHGPRHYRPKPGAGSPA